MKPTRVHGRIVRLEEGLEERRPVVTIRLVIEGDVPPSVWKRPTSEWRGQRADVEVDDDEDPKPRAA